MLTFFHRNYIIISIYSCLEKIAGIPVDVEKRKCRALLIVEDSG